MVKKETTEDPRIYFCLYGFAVIFIILRRTGIELPAKLLEKLYETMSKVAADKRKGVERWSLIQFIQTAASRIGGCGLLLIVSICNYYVVNCVLQYSRSCFANRLFDITIAILQCKPREVCIWAICDCIQMKKRISLLELLSRVMLFRRLLMCNIRLQAYCLLWQWMNAKVSQKLNS